jgi:hypothetical protein
MTLELSFTLCPEQAHHVVQVVEAFVEMLCHDVVRDSGVDVVGGLAGFWVHVAYVVSWLERHHNDEDKIIFLVLRCS